MSVDWLQYPQHVRHYEQGHLAGRLSVMKNRCEVHRELRDEVSELQERVDLLLRTLTYLNERQSK